MYIFLLAWLRAGIKKNIEYRIEDALPPILCAPAGGRAINNRQSAFPSVLFPPSLPSQTHGADSLSALQLLNNTININEKNNGMNNDVNNGNFERP